MGVGASVAAPSEMALHFEQSEVGVDHPLGLLGGGPTMDDSDGEMMGVGWGVVRSRDSDSMQLVNTRPKKRGGQEEVEGMMRNSLVGVRVKGEQGGAGKEIDRSAGSS